MNEFWLCFIPLFVAVDVVGVLPLFISLTDGLDEGRLKSLIALSVSTAWVVAIVFLTLGPALLHFLGVTVADFMVAGGILLLVISLNDLLTGQKKQRQVDGDEIGAVPIGVPLITGPAVLTTCLLLAGTHGKPLTAAALTVNVLLVGMVFRFARSITRRLGRTGTKTVSKVASLLLAAIAVMLIRKGIVDTLSGMGH